MTNEFNPDWMCVCGDLTTLGIVHRKDGPCYWPDKREWVGLTKEERDGKRVLENGLLFNTAEAQVWEIAVEWAEQKLKERNT